MTNPFPDLPPDEYNALLLDIEQHGIVYPVIRDQHDITIDGHQRERIATTLGISCPVKVVPVRDEAHRLELAIALNARRRHLTPEQKREAILLLDPAKTQLSQRDIGRAVDVSQSTVSKVLAEAREGGVIPTNNSSSLPTTKTQQAAGKRSTGARGGRPKSKPPEFAGLNRKKGPTRHTDFGKGPAWMRHFTVWVRKALPEQRKHLLYIDERVHKALALIDGQEGTP